MQQIVGGWGVRLAIAALVGGMVLGESDSVLAELVPDDSLGDERSRVLQTDVNRAEIEGGAQRGHNLFHSFRQFDVPNAGSVYFSIPDHIQNIVTRVTGNRASRVDGILGVRGSANLFLLNPNGVIFGENAQLDVRGAFLATTANEIQFGDGGFFSASTANPVSLLTVNPSALIFNQISSAGIENRAARLRVANAQSLLLVGGDIVFDQGRLFSAGGHIELGGLAAPGAIQLTRTNNQLSLQFPDQVEKSDVSLTNQSRLDRSTFESPPGDLVITAHNINFLSGTVIFTRSMTLEATNRIRLANWASNGISAIVFSAPLIGRLPLTGGDVQIIARSIVLEDGAMIEVDVDRPDASNFEIRSQSLSLDNDAAIRFAVGAEASSQLNITVDWLRLESGASISASTASQNNGGDITIRADSIDLNGSSANALASTRIQSETEDIGLSSNLGNAGNITLNANRIAIRNGATVSTQSASQGQGGRIEIVADKVLVAGSSANSRSGIFSGPRSLGIGTGNGGDIDITTRQLAVRGGGIISASTIAGGRGGNINIEADTIQLLGSSADGELLSAIASESIGTRLSGDAGDINIQTNQLNIRAGALISTQTQASGQAGDIAIRADRIVLSGASPDSSQDVSRSRISSSVVEPKATGNAGTIVLDAEDLRLNEGAILAFTKGQGNAGSIIIPNANSIRLQNDATISTAAEAEATGNAGNIRLRANSLQLSNRSTITSSTSGQGNTGIIAIQALDRILIRGGSITSSVNLGAIGDSEQILLITPDLLLQNNAVIAAATDGNGRAGDIRITADRLSSTNSMISTQVGQNAIVPSDQNRQLQTRLRADRQGDIVIDVASLNLNNAEMTSSTGGFGNAGNIRVYNADEILVRNSGISTQVERNGRGRGGNILLSADEFNLSSARITANTEGQGQAGDITVRNANRILVNRSTISSAVGEESTGQGGDIRLETNNLNLNRARISARTEAEGRGGNISIRADDAIESADSNIETRSADSSSGNVTLTAETVRLREDSDIRTQVNRGEGTGGNINLSANSIVAYSDSDIVTRAPEGQGGDISIDSPAFFAEGYIPDLQEQDNNNRVDIDASGVRSGTVTTPDVSFIQNSLSDLPGTAISSDRLLASSCIARSESGGTFLITGSGGLPERPGNSSASTYSTGEVRSIPVEAAPQDNQSWQPGDAIVEPQGIYRLPDGRLIMSRACSSSNP